MGRRQLSIARSRQLAEHATRMRSHLNPAEAKLWSLLNRRQLGAVFRRQVVVLGRYFADFLAPSLKLSVEVDGGYHCRRLRADARRDEALRRAGYTVVRLKAEFMLRAPEEAIAPGVYSGISSLAGMTVATATEISLAVAFSYPINGHAHCHHLFCRENQLAAPSLRSWRKMTG